MPHRGRLNVLANVMSKPFKAIFSEFFGKTAGVSKDFEGDVKYHLGASSNREFDGNSVHKFNRQPFSFRGSKSSCFRASSSKTIFS